MSAEIRKRLEEIQVSLASKGKLDGYLPPHLWEPLRRNLQGIYRQATGEGMAMLKVEEPPT